MSRLTKSAAIAFVIVAGWTIYFGLKGIAMTGSGGLGAVSAGVSEALIELLGLTALVWILLYLKSRFRRASQPATRD